MLVHRNLVSKPRIVIRPWMTDLSVRAVGEEPQTQLTALGDAANVTARLASSAGAGEILVSVDAALAAGLDPTLERRHLQLKRKQQTTEVVTITVRPAATPSTP